MTKYLAAALAIVVLSVSVRAETVDIKETGLGKKLVSKVEPVLKKLALGNESEAYIEALTMDGTELSGTIVMRHRHKMVKQFRGVTVFDGDIFDITQRATFRYDTATNRGDAELDLSVSVAGKKIPVKVNIKELVKAALGR